MSKSIRLYCLKLKPEKLRAAFRLAAEIYPVYKSQAGDDK